MGGGSQYPFGHPGSQDATIPEPYGVDPSIAPGLARPQGWRVALPDGTGAWDKVGPLDTDWQLVGSGAPGDVTDVVAGDAGVVVTNGAGPIVTVGQVIAAEWTIDRCRVYAVDFVNGLDTNAGFADPTATGAAAYAVACAAAGAVAKKTLAGLAAIFPRVGNGRLVEIVIANGGTQTAQTYTGGLDTFLAGVQGYASACPFVRGTGTDTTAGAVAFAGSTADVTFQGNITATGTNAAGYIATGAPTTTVIQCLKTGGGAAALPAEPATGGWRIRFDSATATVALRNVCRQLCQITGTDTVSVQTALPAVPATGAGADKFYIEMGGVIVAGYALNSSSPPVNLATISSIRSTGLVTASNAGVRFVNSSCLIFAGLATGYNFIETRQEVVHPVLSTLTIGGGLRVESLTLPSEGSYDFAGLWCAAAFTIATPQVLRVGAGCFFNGALTVNGAQLNTETVFTTSATPVLGITIAVAQPRSILGGVLLGGFEGSIAGMVITGAGGNPAIKVRGPSKVIFAGAVCSGATGNTDVGLDLTLARGALILLATTPTVTGALGDVRLAGGQIITWAQAIATGIADSAGNRIYGTAGTPPLGMDTKSGAILSGVAAAASWMADDSWTSLVALGANNNVFQQRWPTSLRLMTRLRLMLCNPEPTAQAVSATLYKNGVATAMTCTLPIGSMNFDKVVDTAHPILFLDGDDWAVRLNTGIMGAEGPTLYLCTATVEWAA